MRLYALVEAGDPEAIDIYLCEQDAQRALEDCLRDEPQWQGLLRVEEIEFAGRVAVRELRIAAVAAVVLLAAFATTTAPARIDDADKGCNVRLKGLKTLSDPQRKLVNLHPKNTTLAAINALPQPQPTPRTRTTAFERQVWRVNVQITEFKLEGDSDIHLVMFGDGAYGIAEMPAAQCLPKTTRDRKAITAARKKFATACGQPTNSWKQLGAVVSISGVGFFDIPHTQKPHAINFAELHPVTGFKLISGCGA